MKKLEIVGQQKMSIQLLLLAISSLSAGGFQTAPSRAGCWRSRQLQARSHDDDDTTRPLMAFLPEQHDDLLSVNRRHAVSTMLATSALLPSAAKAEEPGNIFAPKFVQEYPGIVESDRVSSFDSLASTDVFRGSPDFTVSDEGWAYKEVKIGNKDDGKGDLKDGDRVVFDWSGCVNERHFCCSDSSRPNTVGQVHNRILRKAF